MKDRMAEPVQILLNMEENQMTQTITIGDTAGDELLRIKEQLKTETYPNIEHVVTEKNSQQERSSSTDANSSLCSNGPIEIESAATIDAARLQQKRLIAELSELEMEKRWKDILTLAHPLGEKYPLLQEMELDLEINRKIGFALIRCNRPHDAMKLFKSLLKTNEHDFLAHYSLAYAAYDMLYKNKNKELLLSSKEKKQCIQTAHEHFSICSKLRPDSVTVLYRQAMLYKEIEDKPKKAIPLFEKAISNWEALGSEEKAKRHQERPKYIRSLYHLASCLLRLSLTNRALELLQKLLKEDEATGFISGVFKQFALGKTLFRMGRYSESLDHLKTAAAMSGKNVPDFIRELTAGCLLMLDKPEQALIEVNKIPEKHMRPYVRWRKADILVALDKHEEAILTLEKALDRDGNSRHKTLLRMARIHYSQSNFDKALSCAKRAGQFFQKRYGNKLEEATFLTALCHLGKGNCTMAKSILESLSMQGFSCPGFRKALLKAKEACGNRLATNTITLKH